MYLVVAELLQKGVADLRETEALLALDDEGDNVNAVERHRADLQFL